MKEERVNVGEPDGSLRIEYQPTSLSSKGVEKVVRKSDEA
jgi:hypothetical protein